MSRNHGQEERRISLVMPCYNEEACIAQTASALCDAFRREGVQLDLVLVDNGSTDRTGEIIDGLIADGLPVRKLRVAKNRGYSDGVLRGLEVCDSAPLVGHLCADGQVSAEDVVLAYRLMEGREDRILAKVRRRFRRDSWRRKIVSIIYNAMMQGVFGWLGAIDLNGTPKIYSRKNLDRMKLRSRDWFLDPEIMIKAKTLRLRVIEIDVEGHARRGGKSNVGVKTMVEFLFNIIRYRFRELRRWRREIEPERAGLRQGLDGAPGREAADWDR